jgi:hypothetical protein
VVVLAGPPSGPQQATGLVNEPESPGARGQAADSSATPSAALPSRSADVFIDALERVEPGLAKDILEHDLADDLAVLDADHPAALVKYPSVPVEALPHFANMALRRDLDSDTFLSGLDTLFARLGRNRTHARDLRTLLVLAEAGGGDTPALVKAFLGSSLSKHEIAHAVRSILAESPQGVAVDKIAEAVDLLSRHQNPARIIAQRMNDAVLQRFNLAQLRSDESGKITEKGLAEVTEKLLPFFAKGLAATQAIDPRTGQLTFDEKSLEAVLVAVLEDRYDGFRFTTAKAGHQLKSLNPEQRAQFIEGQEMTHVRFSGNSEQEFRKRISIAIEIGADLLAHMERAWGSIAEVRAEHARLVEALRRIDNNDLLMRKPVKARIRPLSDQKVAMDYAEKLAGLTPENLSPIAFARLGERLKSLARASGSETEPLLRALGKVLNIDDLAYREALSTDRPDLATVEAVLADCVKWPSTDAMGYLTDANLRFIVTRATDGKVCRAIMRLVERQDPGHRGEPMLILERAYPDAQDKEDKRRLMEHAVRRARAMKIAAAFPTEYYWDAASTRRGAKRGIVDMNDVIEDLNRRYGSVVERRTLTVTNPAGSSPSIYIDSAPYDLSHIGRIPSRKTGVKARRYDGRVDNTYTNIFMVLDQPMRSWSSVESPFRTQTVETGWQPAG